MQSKKIDKGLSLFQKILTYIFYIKIDGNRFMIIPSTENLEAHYRSDEKPNFTAIVYPYGKSNKDYSFTLTEDNYGSLWAFNKEELIIDKDINNTSVSVLNWVYRTEDPSKVMDGVLYFKYEGEIIVSGLGDSKYKLVEVSKDGQEVVIVLTLSDGRERTLTLTKQNYNKLWSYNINKLLQLRELNCLDISLKVNPNFQNLISRQAYIKYSGSIEPINHRLLKMEIIADPDNRIVTGIKVILDTPIKPEILLNDSNYGKLWSCRRKDLED